MTKTAAKFYEVRYRVSGTDTAWSSPTRFKVTDELVIIGLTGGKTYSVQARAISVCGAMSGWNDQADITVADVSQRVSQSNINMLRVGGIGSAWTGLSVTYTSAPTTATISTTAATLQDGAGNPSYGAASVAVSGTASTTAHYWLYFDDPSGLGGTIALGATASYSDLTSNQGRVWVGELDVIFPASGSSSGGGTSGGGGPCPVVEAWVYARRGWIVAGDVAVGDELWLPREQRWGRVTYSHAKLAECVRIDTANDVPLSCSSSAPIGVTSGPDILAPDLLGVDLPSVIDGTDIADTCNAITPIGVRWVQHITCEHSHFLAGNRKGSGLYHHNFKPG